MKTCTRILVAASFCTAFYFSNGTELYRHQGRDHDAEGPLLSGRVRYGFLLSCAGHGDDLGDVRKRGRETMNEYVLGVSALIF